MRAVIFAGVCAAYAGIAPALAAASFAPANWDAGLRLAEARDTNPDPKVVEIDLDARIADVDVAPGRRVRACDFVLRDAGLY